MRLLIVKTSSMGDVVHALPALSDMHRAVPGIEVDWLVEAPFAAIPALHPGVRRVLPLSWRKWRHRLFRRDTWSAMAALRAQLRESRYDLILDLQGLLKSALWARQAVGPVAGYDHGSAREGLASWLYSRRAPVARELHAVERCRRLAAAHLGYALPDSAPDFGIRAPAPTWGAPDRYAVLIPNASRPEKLWPEARWITVGRRLHDRGWRPVVLWGSDAEQTLAERIAAGCDGEVPPFCACTRWRPCWPRRRRWWVWTPASRTWRPRSGVRRSASIVITSRAWQVSPAQVRYSAWVASSNCPRWPTCWPCSIVSSVRRRCRADGAPRRYCSSMRLGG